MYNIILTAILYVYGINNLISELIEFLCLCLDVIKDTLATLMSLDLFTYLMTIGIALVTIYFIIDLLTMHERELLTFYSLAIGFIKLFFAYLLVAYSADVVLAISGAGYSLFEDFKNILEEESRVYLVVSGVWGTDLTLIKGLATIANPSATIIAETAAAVSGTVGAEKSLHTGTWIFSPDYKYDALYSTFMPFGRGDYSMYSADVSFRGEYRSALSDIKQSLSITDNTPFNCRWAACAYHSGSKGHTFESFLADENIFGNSAGEYISNIGIISLSTVICIAILIVKIICFFLTGKITFEFLLYALMSPIGVAHLLDNGQRSKGIIYLRKLIAKTINFTVMLFSFYIFNKMQAKINDALFWGAEPIVELNGSVSAYTTAGDRKYILLCIAACPEREGAYALLEDVFRLDIIIYTLIPLAGLLASLTSVTKISNDLLNVN